MQWQDGVFAVSSWVFIISLIPTIRGKEKPALITSVTSSIMIVIFAVAQFTLSLWLATVSSLAVAVCWAILAYQKYRQKK